MCSSDLQNTLSIKGSVNKAGFNRERFNDNPPMGGAKGPCDCERVTERIIHSFGLFATAIDVRTTIFPYTGSGLCPGCLKGP